MSDNHMTGLQKAIKRAGGIAEFSDAVGVRPATVRKWLAEEGAAPVAASSYPPGPVVDVVREAGGPTAMAAELGVSYQAVCNWMRQGWMPNRRAQEVEALYGVPRATLVSPRVRDSLGLGGEL